MLVIVLAAGYAIVLLVSDAFDRLPENPGSQQLHLSAKIVAALARTRWYWVPAVYGLALMVVLIVTHGQDAAAAQFMYRRF